MEELSLAFLLFFFLYFFQFILQDSGVLRADEFSCLDWESNPGPAQLGDILRVHDYTYVQKLGEIFDGGV